MLLNVILWVASGALIGGIAARVMYTNEQTGAVANVFAGIVGAFVGGFIASMFTGDQVGGFNLTSLIVAIIGAVVLLAIVKLVARGGTQRV